jgi:hypothetical protein
MIDGKFYNLELKITPFKSFIKRKKVDISNLQFAILLNTPKLGLLEILIQIYNKAISCNINVENELIKDFLEENLKSLKTSLQNLDFKVEDLKLNIKNLREITRKFREEPRFFTIGKIDIRA